MWLEGHRMGDKLLLKHRVFSKVEYDEVEDGKGSE